MKLRLCHLFFVAELGFYQNLLTSPQGVEAVPAVLSGGSYQGWINRSAQRKSLGEGQTWKVTLANQRISNVWEKPQSTVAHMRAALGIIEHWLKSSPRCDQRKVENIPPADLDAYLCDFFLNGKKRSGENFGRSYLSVFRSCLERHLREKGYPYSITKCSEFVNSQNAYKRRVEALRKLSLSTSGARTDCQSTSVDGPVDT